MTETVHELMLTRLIDAPREKLFRCWTEPELLKRWFAPLPVTTPVAEVDLRVGGASRIVMRGPDGQEIDFTRYLPRDHSRPEAGVHRRLHRRLGAQAGQAVHDQHHHLRG
jgi:hypothetical protein